MKDHDLYETPADERLQNGLWQGVPELALWERTVLSVRDALAARWQESWEGKVALIGFMATSDMNAPVQTAAALASGTLAFESHLTKATSRAVINTSPDPFTTGSASIIEDVIVAGLIFLIIAHPLIALITAVCCFLVSLWFLKIMFRFVKKLVRSRKETKQEIKRRDG